MNKEILLACRDASLGYEGKAIWEHLDFREHGGNLKADSVSLPSLARR